MEEFQASARTISALTYQERMLSAGLPDTPEFRAAMVKAAAQDLVRNFVLFHRERPVAFAYCSGKGRELTYRIIGYDPEYRDQSPGRVLLYLLLERLFAERRFDAIDFGPGEALYKSMFATGHVACSDVYYFRPTLRNAAFVSLQTGMAATSRGMVLLTSQLGIKDKLKKWFRLRAAT
jgi:CelD/BcsL family acetyltransferase involved in cellulose biosynthesis